MSSLVSEGFCIDDFTSSSLSSEGRILLRLVDQGEDSRFVVRPGARAWSILAISSQILRSKACLDSSLAWANASRCEESWGLPGPSGDLSSCVLGFNLASACSRILPCSTWGEKYILGEAYFRNRPSCADMISDLPWFGMVFAPCRQLIIVLFCSCFSLAAI